ncbi:hypothetical protein EDD85DRAFT_788816 [Armillaria nabsnona]|nr:hypothetical protein EDD85DRAFT_788816 [Armillaria nabsnona]
MLPATSRKTPALGRHPEPSPASAVTIASHPFPPIHHAASPRLRHHDIMSLSMTILPAGYDAALHVTYKELVDFISDSMHLLKCQYYIGNYDIIPRVYCRTHFRLRRYPDRPTIKMSTTYDSYHGSPTMQSEFNMTKGWLAASLGLSLSRHITMDDNNLNSALVSIRSHLVEVLKPSDSPRTQKHKKAVAALVKQMLYDLVKMVEDEEDDEDKDKDELPGKQVLQQKKKLSSDCCMAMLGSMTNGQVIPLIQSTANQDDSRHLFYMRLSRICKTGTHGMVHAFGSELDATSFLQYILRMIETLKFIE